ncbi:MAG: 50S ribosomal protein L4 [Gammaproteobacteria bacterium]|nr:MAG: 50S ribosomal protein L4 [Gammaproteobacteria bacterium]
MELKTHGGGAVSVSDAVFGASYNEGLVHQIVTAYLAGARAGTVAQKTRSEVSGGGTKPWRQKGTGRARAGTIRSPLWTGGGVTFAAKPRDYSQKVNKKMYRGALRSILSHAAAEGSLVVVDDMIINEPKTRLMRDRLAELDAARCLVLLDEVTENIYLAARNLPNVQVLDVEGVDPVSLVRHPKIVATTAAIKKLEERLA